MVSDTTAEWSTIMVMDGAANTSDKAEWLYSEVWYKVTDHVTEGYLHKDKTHSVHPHSCAAELLLGDRHRYRWSWRELHPRLAFHERGLYHLRPELSEHSSEAIDAQMGAHQAGNADPVRDVECLLWYRRT